jgi:hypothetical protein
MLVAGYGPEYFSTCWTGRRAPMESTYQTVSSFICSEHLHPVTSGRYTFTEVTQLPFRAETSMYITYNFAPTRKKIMMKCHLSHNLLYFYNGSVQLWIWNSLFKVQGISISKYKNWVANSLEPGHGYAAWSGYTGGKGWSLLVPANHGLKPTKSFQNW